MSSVNPDSNYHCGGWKIEQLVFWLKKPNFQAISTQENLMNTFTTLTNYPINFKYPKNNPKSKIKSF
jgi:hypothetical protein